SSVGHGGASGYLAAMALFGVSATLMKPAALTMNIVVAGLVFVRLWRAGYFNARLFWSFALGSIPLAFVGGAILLHERAYQYLVAVALLVAAWRLLVAGHEPPTHAAPRPGVALPLGAGLGFVSGLTGVGGGIFLSPLLLLLRWASMRTTAAVSSAFILVNSIAGLAGLLGSGVPLPGGLPWMVVAALAGAVVGSELAVRRLAPARLRQLLGVVLVIAAVKMALTA
ncbi:MAG: sulfite exporter TauE/SafE family protein, partial [Gammaproteobacteria bacterium]|nr:sulfite exporter TauE/SafE family protein [Gammaproteobacteria bacterium]